MFGHDLDSSRSKKYDSERKIKNINNETSRVDTDHTLSLSKRFKNIIPNDSKDFGDAIESRKCTTNYRIKSSRSPNKKYVSALNKSQELSDICYLDQTDIISLERKIKERKTLNLEKSRKDIICEIKSENNEEINNSSKIKHFKGKFYGVISKFYVVKKFIKLLRNASYIRYPTKYQINKMQILNDNTFYKEGLILKTNDHKKRFQFKGIRVFLVIFTSFLHIFMKFLEILKQKINNNFIVFDPTKTLRSIWDSFHMIILSFYFFKIPVDLSFEINLLDSISQINVTFADFLNYLGVVFLFSDIFVNFNTGYYKKGTLISGRKNIAKHYIKRSFFFDVLSFIPIILEFLNFGFNYNFKFLFFFRVKNFFRIFSRIEESIHINFKLFNLLTLLKVIARIVILSHLFACGWHYISYKSLSHTSDTWLNFNHMANEIWWKKYVSSYYFVCVTMNTVGYGDTVPQNDTERLFCIFFIYVACGIFAYTLNVVGYIIQQISKNKSQFLNNIMIINEYMNKKRINFDLRMRIRKYLEYVWKEEQSQNSYEENLIIDKLSSSLKKELLLETNGKILAQIPFFNKNFSNETLRKLVYRLEETHFMPGDIIYEKSDFSNNSLYILWKGEVQLYMDVYNINMSEHIIEKIEKGKTFGEKEFITGCQREISAKSSSFSTVYILNYNDFLSVLHENLEDYTKFIEIKDKASLYDNYIDFKRICSYCQDTNHSIIECQFLHYIPTYQRVIQKYLYYNPNERTKKLRNRKKTNSLKKQKFVQFVAKTMQQVNFYCEEENNENNPPSETILLELRENKMKLNNNGSSEFDQESDDLPAESINNINPINAAINSSKNIFVQDENNIKKNADKPLTKLNDKRISEAKIIISGNNYSQNVSKTIFDDNLTKNPYDGSYISKNKIQLNSKIATTNSFKLYPPLPIESKIKENTNKENENSDHDRNFERKMDYEFYFPNNNSDNIISLLNKSKDVKSCTQNFKKCFGRRGILSPDIKTLKKEFAMSMSKKEPENNLLSSKKKSIFFLNKNNNDEVIEKQDNFLDRKSIIKILKTKQKEKKKNIFQKSFGFFMNLMKEE